MCFDVGIGGLRALPERHTGGLCYRNACVIAGMVLQAAPAAVCALRADCPVHSGSVFDEFSGGDPERE